MVTRVAAAAVTALALTGCVRIQADTSIGSNDTFSQHVIVAFTNQVAAQVTQQAGVDVRSLAAGIEESPQFTDLQDKYPGQVTLADYSDEDLHGIELTIEDLPLSEFNGAASQVTGAVGATASIERVDDSFIVQMGGADSPAEPGGGVDGPDATPPPGIGDALDGLDLDSLGLGGGSLAALGSAIEFEVSYTFPGLVTEASAGDIDGNTVTLAVGDLLDGKAIRIVGGASDQTDWWPFIKWSLIVGAFVVIVGGALLLVRQDQRRQRSNSLPAPVVGGTTPEPGNTALVQDHPTHDVEDPASERPPQQR